jgi:hypothetical protein
MTIAAQSQDAVRKHLARVELARQLRRVRPGRRVRPVGADGAPQGNNCSR